MSKIDYQQIRVGGFYVNESKGRVRELVSDMGDGDVYWLSYSLTDGQPWGDSHVCSKENIRKWATREATREEVANLQRGKAHSDHSARDLEMTHKFLKNIPDAMLLAEVNRRGLHIAPRER